MWGGEPPAQPRPPWPLPRAPAPPPAAPGAGPVHNGDGAGSGQAITGADIQLYMQRDEVEALLLAHARVAPAFTGLVWDRLVAQNEAFFESYFTRCRLKDQIVAYNALLLQLQALLQQGAAAAAAAFGGGDGLQFAADATPHGGDGDGGGGGDRWWPLSLSRRGTEEDE